MKISEMIKELCDKLVEHGDIEVIIQSESVSYREEVALRMIECESGPPNYKGPRLFQTGTEFKCVEIF